MSMYNLSKTKNPKFKYPKVSIIVPIYGVANYIENCINSALVQSYPNIEFIFINDCTKDDSMWRVENVVKRFPNLVSSIKIINNKNNLGLAETRNIGILEATGEYIFHLDGDDYMYSPDVISFMVETAVSTGADIVEADYVMETSSGLITKNIKRNYSDKKVLITDLIRKNTSITIWNKLINKSLYTDYNIEVPPGINNGEDYITLIRLFFFAKRIEHINIITYVYNNLNPSAFSKNQISFSNLSNMIEANRFLYNFFIENSKQYLPSINTMYFETKAYCLLHARSRVTLNTIRELFYKYELIISKGKMRYYYKFVLVIDRLRVDYLLLIIGKWFRKRKD